MEALKYHLPEIHRMPSGGHVYIPARWKSRPYRIWAMVRMAFVRAVARLRQAAARPAADRRRHAMGG